MLLLYVDILSLDETLAFGLNIWFHHLMATNSMFFKSFLDLQMLLTSLVNWLATRCQTCCIKALKCLVFFIPGYKWIEIKCLLRKKHLVAWGNYRFAFWLWAHDCLLIRKIAQSFALYVGTNPLEFFLFYEALEHILLAIHLIVAGFISEGRLTFLQVLETLWSVLICLHVRIPSTKCNIRT